jgi:predicted ATPase
MAYTGKEPALLLGAHFVSASSLFHLGRFAESRDHMQESLVAQSSPTPSVLALFAGPDIGVFCRAYLGHVLWHLGQTELSSRAMGESLAAAQRVENPFAMAIALTYSAMLHVFRDESAAALIRAEEAAALCRKHHFVYYLAMANILSGWARAREGDAEAGLAKLRYGLEALKATGAELRLPFYYALLAQSCASAGLHREATANIATGLAYQSKNGELWAAPFLTRVQSELNQS